MAESRVSDELWQEFHDVVNMTSRELSDWLRTEAAEERTEPAPDQPGLARGRQVLEILGKRRSDVTDGDVGVMQGVVEEIRTLRGDMPEPEAGDPDVRHLLMSLGHDPLKPTAS